MPRYSGVMATTPTRGSAPMHKHNTTTPKPARVKESFTFKNATSFGGANILADYAEAVGLSALLAEHLAVGRRRMPPSPCTKAWRPLPQRWFSATVASSTSPVWKRPLTVSQGRLGQASGPHDLQLRPASVRYRRTSGPNISTITVPFLLLPSPPVNTHNKAPRIRVREAAKLLPTAGYPSTSSGC